MTGIWKAQGREVCMQEWINTTAAGAGKACILSMQEEIEAKAKKAAAAAVRVSRVKTR